MLCKIGIFDDHPLVLKGLKDLLQSQGEKFQVMFVCSASEALEGLVAAHSPNLLMMDVLAPGILGLELFEKIRLSYPDLQIIAYSSLASPVMVSRMVSMGVRGFVNKKQAEVQVLEALEKVISGGVYLPEGYTQLSGEVNLSRDVILSASEKRVLALIATEQTSHQIAHSLCISENTVENHRKSLFRKLGVKNLAGLIMESTRLGYLR